MKNKILKAVSIGLVLAAVFAIICAATVTGGGFLDLSNIARAGFVGVAMVCGVLAVGAWKLAKPKD